MRSTGIGTALARGFSLRSIKWPLSRASDVLELAYGKALVDADRRPGKVPVYGTNGRCGSHDTPLFRGPGVVIGRKGQGPLGVEWVADDYWVIDTAYSLRPLTPDVSLRFAYYLVKYVGLNHLKDGTSNPTLARATFGAQVFPLPPLAAQKRIGELLSLLDDKIELNRQMNETLEAMARALFKSWFVDFDPVRAKMAGRTPFGMGAATAEIFSATLAGQGWALQPCVPVGWSVLRVCDVVEGVFDGPHATPPDATDGPIFLGIRNFRPTSLDLTEVKHIAESDWPAWTRRVTPTAGDIVFTYEATLGYFGVVPSGVRCCLGRRTALVRPRASSLDGNYLFHWFIGSPFQAHLQAHKNPGSTVDRILLRDFPHYPVLVPPRAIVEAFAQAVAPMGALLEANQAESRTLAELRDLLLPKLLSGELRIRNAERLVEAAL
jgi:type I restriction enzyme S subunit